MKKWGLFGALIFSSSDANALELLCKGTAFVGGMQGDHSFVIDIDKATQTAEVWTPKGRAGGKVESTRESYRGLVSAPDGSEYFMTLDRFSGQLIITPEPLSANGGKAVFMGDCAPASPKF